MSFVYLFCFLKCLLLEKAFYFIKCRSDSKWTKIPWQLNPIFPTCGLISVSHKDALPAFCWSPFLWRTEFPARLEAEDISKVFWDSFISPMCFRSYNLKVTDVIHSKENQNCTPYSFRANVEPIVSRHPYLENAVSMFDPTILPAVHYLSPMMDICSGECLQWKQSPLEELTLNSGLWTCAL